MFSWNSLSSRFYIVQHSFWNRFYIVQLIYLLKPVLYCSADILSQTGFILFSWYSFFNRFYIFSWYCFSNRFYIVQLIFFLKPVLYCSADILSQPGFLIFSWYSFSNRFYVVQLIFSLKPVFRLYSGYVPLNRCLNCLADIFPSVLIYIDWVIKCFCICKCVGSVGRVCRVENMEKDRDNQR